VAFQGLDWIEASLSFASGYSLSRLLLIVSACSSPRKTVGKLLTLYSLEQVTFAVSE